MDAASLPARTALTAEERAHLAHVAEIMVRPLVFEARAALEDGDRDRVLHTIDAIAARLRWINDVLGQLGRRRLDLATLSVETPGTRLRIAALHLATEVIASR